jgi:7-cyano-7-deazaguanine synthase
MKTVVLLSGGLDSTVLLAHLIADGHKCRALSVLYGQRHQREVQAAAAVADHYSVPHEVVELPSSLMAGTTLTGGGAVPHGHYAHESMKATVVPNRNMVLLALAGAVAVRERCNAVGYAAHAGDHFIYPDCRPEFANAVSDALALCDERPISLFRPFVRWSKADIVAEGAKLGVPIGLTWSCYEGGEKHCGRCGTCVERREASEVAGVTDPTEYAA